jgi:hypothetical protein
MLRKTPLLVLSLVMSTCALGSDKNVVEISDDLSVGSHCEVATKDTRSKRAVFRANYVGTIAEINVDSITLHDVTMNQITDRTPPVLGSIPYLKRFFRTAGVGRSHLGDKSRVIMLKDVARIEPMSDEQFEVRSARRR